MKTSKPWTKERKMKYLGAFVVLVPVLSLIHI